MIFTCRACGKKAKISPMVAPWMRLCPPCEIRIRFVIEPRGIDLDRDGNNKNTSRERSRVRPFPRCQTKKRGGAR
jgi:hypothetical protein